MKGEKGLETEKNRKRDTNIRLSLALDLPCSLSFELGEEIRIVEK